MYTDAHVGTRVNIDADRSVDMYVDTNVKYFSDA